MNDNHTTTTSSHPPTWNPLTDWSHRDIKWIRVAIGKEDLARFMKRSDLLGAFQTLGFLALLTCTGAFSYWAFVTRHWLLLVLGLYVHGLIYGHFGDALHELGHNTVFASQWLNRAVTVLFGMLFWPWNPHLYRLSHVHYHHRYTLHQGSDGEDVPNYVALSPRVVFESFFRVLRLRELALNLARLLTLKPTSKGWRGRGYRLDTWETFVIARASAKDRRLVHRFAVASLVVQLAFVALCIAVGQPFLIVLVTLAPFYGPGFHSMLCGTHQHACCEANHPDFRISCGDARLDPLSSFLYWHMEYHIEHHMFAGIPCYRLKAFSRFAADQLPPKEAALPRLLALSRRSPEKFGSPQDWRDNFGRFKGY